MSSSVNKVYLNATHSSHTICLHDKSTSLFVYRCKSTVQALPGWTNMYIIQVTGENRCMEYSYIITVM